MTRYLVIDCRVGVEWLAAKSEHQAQRIADALNRQHHAAYFGFKTEFVR